MVLKASVIILKGSVIIARDYMDYTVILILSESIA
tara:strand:+ start:1850 stop:1954 length:105 start_codon:yes stop_codon:yes gene_type:complete